MKRKNKNKCYRKHFVALIRMFVNISQIISSNYNVKNQLCAA